MGERIAIQMEKMIMTVTEEIIMKMEQLSPEDIHMIIQHFEPEEVFSEEEINTILQAREEAKQGINMSGPFRGEEANEHLRKLMRES